MKPKIYFYVLVCLFSTEAFSTTYNFRSDGYLKAVEMNIGDTLIYQLQSGQPRTFVLRRTSAGPVFTFDNPVNEWHSGIVYAMKCSMMADGQEPSLERIVSAQQSYYEPWHINGVSFFFDTVREIAEFIKDNHGEKASTAFFKFFWRSACRDLLERQYDMGAFFFKPGSRIALSSISLLNRNRKP